MVVRRLAGVQCDDVDNAESTLGGGTSGSARGSEGRTGKVEVASGGVDWQQQYGPARRSPCLAYSRHRTAQQMTLTRAGAPSKKLRASWTDLLLQLLSIRRPTCLRPLSTSSRGRVVVLPTVLRLPPAPRRPEPLHRHQPTYNGPEYQRNLGIHDSSRMEEIPSPGIPNYVSELVAYLSRQPELQGWAPDGTLLALWLMTLMNRGWGGGGGGIILDVDVSSSRRPGGAIARAARQAVTVSFPSNTS